MEKDGHATQAFVDRGTCDESLLSERGICAGGLESGVAIKAVQRSEEQQRKSTEEMNARIEEKENRRREEEERWNSRGQTDAHERGIECAREFANMVHPHGDEHPDLDWYYGPGYAVDDVKGRGS